MKKILASTMMLATFALAGCTSTGTTNNGTGTAIGTANEIGMNVFRAAIDNQCRSQIESEQAPQQVTIVELGNAAIDSQYRTQLVAQVVAKSLQSCYTSFVQ